MVADQNGDFVVRAEIDGRPLRLVFDTGADAIELTASDAERIGLSKSQLVYETPVETANGPTLAAAAVLDRVVVGPIEMRRVAALVARPGALKGSLLGRSFLDRLAGYSASSSRLVLRAASP